VFFYEPQRFIEDPFWVIQIWKGGLASHGATLGLLVAMYVYARRHRQSYVECMDRFALSAGLGATLVRLGNFFNSEIMGKLTDQTWGVRFPRFDAQAVALHGQAPLRHPTQLYEFALGLFVMFCIWLVDRLLGREERPRGALIATFFAVYFTGRFFVEFFKIHQTLPDTFPLTMGQLLSLPLALAGIAALIYSIRAGVPAHWNAAAAAPTSPPRRSKKSRKRVP
jgi:phosphatidylglycerol---prolipoprotein diacylglyceryl transferase